MCLLTVTLSGNECPAGWHYYNGQCFFVSTTTANQKVAREKCQDENGDLASIYSNNEMNFIRGIL